MGHTTITPNGTGVFLEHAGAVAVAVEAAAAVAGALVTIVSWAGGHASDARVAAYVAAFGIVVAAGLALVARGLWRGARWPRGGALTWQVIEAGVAFGATNGQWWLMAIVLLPVPFALAGVIAGAVRTQRSGG